jgi:hypothetical protein
MSDWIQLPIKYKGKCTECGNEIAVGEYALWSRASKAIKHVKCKSLAVEKNEIMPDVPELSCFICGKSARCPECHFEADCDRQVVSQACICSPCLEDKQAFSNYKQAFVKKTNRVAKAKL